MDMPKRVWTLNQIVDAQNHLITPILNPGVPFYEQIKAQNAAITECAFVWATKEVAERFQAHGFVPDPPLPDNALTEWDSQELMQSLYAILKDQPHVGTIYVGENDVDQDGGMSCTLIDWQKSEQSGESSKWPTWTT